MSKKTTSLFLFTFLLNAALNIFVVFCGYFMAGIIMLLSTLLVYSLSYIWLVQKQDAKFGFKNKIFIIPLGVIFFGILKSFNLLSLGVGDGLENLETVGQMMLSRYQAVMWVFGVVLMVSFVVSAASVDKERT